LYNHIDTLKENTVFEDDASIFSFLNLSPFKILCHLFDATLYSLTSCSLVSSQSKLPPVLSITMKIYASLLALCVLQTSSTAFVPHRVPRSNALQHGILHSSNSNLDGMGAPLGNGAGDQSPGGPSAPLAKPAAKVKQGSDIWDTSAPVKVQGGSLRTWSFSNSRMNFAQVLLKTDGRPLNGELHFSNLIW
jgi:hypothetical protein